MNLIRTILILLLTCLGFAYWQNHSGTVGGAISLAKTLWLFLALTFFLLIPAWLWRDGRLSRLDRNGFGLFFAGYALRGAVELPLLLLTRHWRCWHGIAHNGVMLLFLGLCWPRESRVARRFCAILALALVFESLNAWLFSRAGSPQTGVYFASDDAAFRLINQITWAELALLTPLLLGWLNAYRKAGTL